MAVPKYSIIVPVFNRPDEVSELLESLLDQVFKDFEVLIIEDGSTIDCKSQVEKYRSRLDIKYFYKENSGQGFSRNYGFKRAKGEWLVVFDSDCIIPVNYFEKVDMYLDNHPLDAYGGPDRASENFTLIQKAISYSMTSLFTTGGIRGNKKHLGVFHPRSFNMGITKEVFEKTTGYVLPKKGEDIEFSIRIIEGGFKTGLIEEAFVYHKRRTNFRQFFRQLHFFGTARINVCRFYKNELKLVHFFPSIFFLGLVSSVMLLLFFPKLGVVGLAVYVIYAMLVLVDSMYKTRSISVGFLSIISSFIQLSAYGMGFIKEGLNFLLRS